MEETKKCACGMPLDENTECKCKPENCIYCCECEEGCDCGCTEKADEDDDEEGCCACSGCDKGCAAKDEDDK